MGQGNCPINRFSAIGLVQRDCPLNQRNATLKSHMGFILWGSFNQLSTRSFIEMRQERHFESNENNLLL